jgi:hypothetical protein
MEGLLRRLASDGSEAENALRVIAFFDRLVEARGDLDELVRSCARLIGAPAGLTGESLERSIAYTQFGRPSPTEPPEGALKKQIASATQSHGLAWIDGSSQHVALGELVVERMASSAAIIVGRRTTPASPSSLPALERLLSPESSADERVSAARALGFRSDMAIRALAIQTHRQLPESAQELESWASALGVKVTAPRIEGGLVVALVGDAAVLDESGLGRLSGLSALGHRAAVTDARDSIATARQAIRLTSSFLGPSAVDYESLGPLSHIASITPAQAAQTSIVRKLLFLRQSEVGTAELLALDTFCRYGSLRAASSRLNLHHSSLAHRLKNASRKLDVDLTRPESVAHVWLALQLYRIASHA